ncbi:MAG: thiamine pyrophosphate-dependent dehydrogenase E1 component subunit alpha [Actinomycetota bacterium]
MKLDLLAAYRWMRLTREVDEAIRTLWLTGHGVGGTFNQRGHEAISVGPAMCLDAHDVVAPMHRDLGAFLVRGITPGRLLAHQLGRVDGPSGGRDCNIHGCGDVDLNIIGFISHLPQSLATAGGAARAFKMRGDDRVAMTWTGDGGSITGLYAESLNLAALDQAPVVIIVENNQYAYSTPIADHSANPDIAERTEALGVTAVEVDGNDIEAVHKASRKAVNRARNGGGPTVIVAETMRMLGHAIHDGFEYVPKDLLDKWEARDPLTRFLERATDHGIAADRVAAIDAEVADEVAAALDFAHASPLPDPATVTDGVWAP